MGMTFNPFTGNFDNTGSGITQAAADTRYVNISGDTMTGALVINANLTVDTNVLFVDASSNEVGILTASPVRSLNVNGKALFGTATDPQGAGSTHTVDIVASSTDSPLTLYQGSGNMEIWKDMTPTKAIAIGMAVPGSAIGDDLVISTYSSTWSERLRLTSAAGLMTVQGSGLIGGYLRVGSTSAPTNTTAGDLTFVRGFATSAEFTTNIAVGTTIDSTIGINTAKTFSTGTGTGIYTTTTNTASSGNNAIVGLHTRAIFNGSYNQTDSAGEQSGIVTYSANTSAYTMYTAKAHLAWAENTSSGAITNAYGITTYLHTGGSGVITNAYGLRTTAWADQANITNYHNIHIEDGTSWGAQIGTQYGIYIANMTGGTTNRGIYFAGTGTGNSIDWAGDTNIYRSAANTLKTDDAFIVTGAITVTSGSITGITDLAVADGGTGASTAADARTNLGLVAGGAGDIWVEKAGDTMTGKLSITNAHATDYALDLHNTDDTNDSMIRIKMDSVTHYPHIKWEDTDGNPAVQMTAHEQTDGAVDHRHFSMYTTNALNSPRNRFAIEFERDYPDILFQRFGTLSIKNQSLTDAERTNINVNDNMVEMDFGLTVDDAGTYTKQGNVLSILNAQVETSGTITDSARCIDIVQNGDTGDAIRITTASTGNSITIDQNGNVGATVSTDGALHIDNSGNTGHGLVVYSTMSGSAAGPLSYMVSTNSAFNSYVLRVQQAGGIAALLVDMNGTAQGILVDHDDTGTAASIEIDRDGNSASTITGLKINTANAGGGAARSLWVEAGTIQFDGALSMSANNITELANLALDSTAVRDMTVGRHASSTGVALTVQSGGAFATGTNLAGGNLILASGISTGSSRSAIQFNVPTSGGSGTADATPAWAATVWQASANGPVISLVANSSTTGIPISSNVFAIRGTVAGGFVAYRHTTANTAGNSLTVQAGGATSAATDKAGGDLVLLSGISTGTANSKVKIQTRTAASSTGTSDNTAVDRIVVTSPKILTDGVATNVVSCTIDSGSAIGGLIRYTIEVTDGTDYQSESGYVVYNAVNKAGTVTRTITEHDSQQAVSAGTLTTAWAISAASPAVISVNADTSLTPSTGYPRITYILENLSQQAVAIQ